MVRDLSTRRLGTQAGYTLIEVMIATTILAALMAVAAAGYAAFLRVWSRPEVFGLASVERLQRRWLAAAAVEGMFDYYVTDPQRVGESDLYPYFQGHESWFRFVTLASVRRHSSPAAAWVRYEPGEGGAGVVVYEESPLDRRYLKFGDDAPASETRIVLYEGVRACRIEYFGWVRFEVSDKTDFEPVSVFRWVRSYTGKQYGHTPQTIHLTAETETGTYDVWFQTRSYNPTKAQWFAPAA